MPYITQDRRILLQDALDNIVKSLRGLELVGPNNPRAGDLNYIFTYLINEMYPINKYFDLNEAIGLLESCKLELYRRRVGPYEETVMNKNGDVKNKPTMIL